MKNRRNRFTQNAITASVSLVSIVALGLFVVQPMLGADNIMQANIAILIVSLVAAVASIMFASGQDAKANQEIQNLNTYIENLKQGKEAKNDLGDYVALGQHMTELNSAYKTMLTDIQTALSEIEATGTATTKVSSNPLTNSLNQAGYNKTLENISKRTQVVAENVKKLNDRPEDVSYTNNTWESIAQTLTYTTKNISERKKQISDVSAFVAKLSRGDFAVRISHIGDAELEASLNNCASNIQVFLKELEKACQSTFLNDMDSKFSGDLSTAKDTFNRAVGTNVSTINKLRVDLNQMVEKERRERVIPPKRERRAASTGFVITPPAPAYKEMDFTNRGFGKY